MPRFSLAFLGLALLAAPTAASAKETTVVLDVHHASCPSCPLIVKSALMHANGVKAVAVGRYTGKGTITATVTYNDVLTSPAALIRVTTIRGYPAEVAMATAK